MSSSYEMQTFCAQNYFDFINRSSDSKFHFYLKTDNQIYTININGVFWLKDRENIYIIAENNTENEITRNQFIYRFNRSDYSLEATVKTLKFNNF